MLKLIEMLKLMILNALFPRPRVGGVGRHDSIGGDYDEQTSFGFDQTRYVEARQRTILGPLSRGSKVSQMIAGGDRGGIDNTACIVRKEINTGDMVRFTQEEAILGMPTWGDNDVVRGDFPAYKNLESRVNSIHSPAMQLPGKNSLRRARLSLKNPKGRLRTQSRDWMAEEMEYEFLIALHWGASKAALRGVADGGLGVNLGVGSNGTAGVPLMPKNFYCIDEGFAAYDDTPATWNSAVNGYANAITAAADTLGALKIKVIRRQMDKLHFAPAYMQGERYKAIALTDPDLWYRLDHLLKNDKRDAMPRKVDHDIFGVDHQLVYQGILFLNVPNMEKFRLGYQASPDYPTIGPGITTDPRDYAVTSSIANILFLGAGACYEGYDGAITTTEEKGYHGNGYEIASHLDMVFIRGEWYAKDGRASAAANCYCNSVILASFYETGVNSLT